MSMLMFGRTLTLSKLPRGPQKRTKTMSNMILIPKNERRRTLANIGQIYSKIPKNTPKISQNAPKTSKTNVKNIKKQRKIVQIWVNINVNVYVNVNVWTNVNVIDATQRSSKTNADDVKEALKFLRRTKTKTKKLLNFLDERSLRPSKKGK